MTHTELYHKLNLFLQEASRYNMRDDITFQASLEVAAMAKLKQVEYPVRILQVRRLLQQTVPHAGHPEHNNLKQILEEILEASREMIANPKAFQPNC